MKHKLAGGGLDVNPERNDAHRRDPPMATAPLVVLLGAYAFGTLDPGVQGQWESRRWPLEPWPRHLLPVTLLSAARDEPFLWRK